MDGYSFKRIRMSILIFLAVLLKIIQRCDSGVVVLLHLGQFINPGSRLWDGSCCNVLHGQCGPCYYEFQVCVSRQSSYPYTHSGEPYCDYGQWHTGMIKQHTDSFYLPTRFPSGHTNPLKIIVPYWEGRVRVRINVRDMGMWGYDNDLVIEYTLYLTEGNPGRTEHDSIWYNWLLVRYGLRLDVQYAVYCQPNYYGRFCRVYCQPPTSYDRYTCDTTTGQKICQRGYTGFDCRRKVLPTIPFRWWRITTKRPVPPKRWTTTVAPIITATAPATASSSSSTTTTTAPVATKNTPASTPDTPTSTHTSSTETPTSTLLTRTTTYMPNFTTDPPTSTTDTPTSTMDTPTSSTRNSISTTDSATSTADTPSIRVNIPTSTTKTSAFTTYKPSTIPHGPISTTKTTQDAETTTTATPTVQTTSPQTLTTTRRVQTKTNATEITTNLVHNMSNTPPVVTQSTKPFTTEPVSSIFEASTHIVEHTSPRVSYSTDKYTTYSTTVETTYLTTDSITESTQSSSATYLKSLTTMSHKYITTDAAITTEMLKASTSEQYLGMKTNKSSHFPTKPRLSGEEVTTLPDLTTDSSNDATDVTYTTNFLTHASEENYVGETSTTNDSTFNTDSTSISPSHTTLPATPKLSKKPTDWRRLKNKTTTAMVTGHALSSSTLASEQNDITDVNTNNTDLATRTPTPDIQDSKTVGPTFPTVTESLHSPQHATSTGEMVYTDSERVSLQTVLVTRNVTLGVERSTTAKVSSLRTTSDSYDPSGHSTPETSFITLSTTASQEPTTSSSSKLITSLTDNDNASTRSSSTSKPITRHSLSISPSPVLKTTLSTITQGRKPNVLQKDNFFPIRTVSPEVCWTWDKYNLRTICDCGHAQLPILPPIHAYWRTSLTTGKPEFLSEKKL